MRNAKSLHLCKGVCFIAAVITLVILISGDSFYAQGNYEDETDSLVVKVLGLESSGDCIILRYNNVQILIDSSQPSENEEKDCWSIIQDGMSKALENDSQKVWDYIIFTHPDKDHVGNALKVLDLFYKEDGWEIGTIIDFDMKEAPEKYFKETTEKYRKERNEICKNKGVSYFAASELTKNNKIKEYKVSDDFSIYILYNYYDDYKVIQNVSKSSGILKDSSCRNDISVCVLLKYKDQKLLFTGDLEEAGEKELVRNHKDILENVDFYKASHHGSEDANSEALLSVIRPCYVSITKMNTENYTAISRFMNYTDYIYPTYVKYDPSPSPENPEKFIDYYKLFGTQEFIFNGKTVIVKTEKNMNEDGEAPSILDAFIEYAEDTVSVNWFNQEVQRENIIDSIAVYILDEGKPEYNNCSLIKYGHYDILIDCGSTDEKSVEFVEKLKKIVTDGNIEYVVVTHYQISNISQLLGTYTDLSFDSNGVFDQFKIGSVIDGCKTNFKVDETRYYSGYLDKVNKFKRISLNSTEKEYIRLNNIKNLSIGVMGNNLSSNQIDENNYSLVTIINFYDKKILFVGDLVNYTGILSAYKESIKDLDFLRLSNSLVSCDVMQDFDKFIEIARPKYIAIGSPLGYDRYSSCFYDEDKLENLHRFLHLYIQNCKVYFCGSIGAWGHYEKDNGDLKYIIKKSRQNTSKKRDVVVYSEKYWEDYLENDRTKLVTIEDKYK